MKILILGHGDHGKDEFAKKLVQKTGLSFKSSSMFASEHVVYPWFVNNEPCAYANADECYADRRNNRPLWCTLILRYNIKEKTRMAREVLTESDVYVGMRAQEEFTACMRAGLFNLIFWVDASKRKEDENEDSIAVYYNQYIMTKVDNNGTLEELDKKVDELIIEYGIKKNTA